MVYVGTRKYRFGRLILSHMAADTIEELHATADKIGVARQHFQAGKRPHYDVCQSKKTLAVKHGAKMVNDRELISLYSRIKPQKVWLISVSDIREVNIEADTVTYLKLKRKGTYKGRRYDRPVAKLDSAAMAAKPQPMKHHITFKVEMGDNVLPAGLLKLLD